MLEIAEELQRRGHVVKLLLADFDLVLLEQRAHPLTQNTSFIVYRPYEDVKEGLQRVKRYYGCIAERSSPKDHIYMYNFFLDTCQRLLTNADAMAKVTAFRPDLVIADIFSQCTTTFIYKMKIPYVSFLPVGMAEPLMSIKFGYLSPPSAVPTSGSSLHHPMSFFQRLQNMVEYVHQSMATYFQLLMDAHLRFNLGMPIIANLTPPRLILVGRGFPIEPPLAMPDGIQYVGTLMPKPAKPLTGDLADLAAASAPEGFVYVSFGTTFGLSDETSLRTLATALASLNRTVLWQISEHTLPQGMTLKDLSVSPRVHPIAWAPQNDVLGSPHLTVFVTHGGLNAFSEALYHGVPVIVMPITGDQHNHAVRAQALGVGLRVDRLSLGRGELGPLVDAVERILYEPSFRQRSREAGALLRAHPVPPAVRAAEWVEAALAMPPGTGLPVSDPAASLWWFVRESHDVHLALAVGAVAVVAAGQWAVAKARRATCTGRFGLQGSLKKTQ